MLWELSDTKKESYVKKYLALFWRDYLFKEMMTVIACSEMM